MIVCALVVSGRRRAWWLIGLAPVLGFRASSGSESRCGVIVNRTPVFVAADQASAFVSDNDWVVGVVDDGDATAYPFACLYGAPLVVQNDQEKPLLLMWSPFANRAVAAGGINDSLRRAGSRLHARQLAADLQRASGNL